MEPLEKLIKSFEGGNILTNEELNLVVAHINRTVDYINDNIKPAIENGIRGLNGRNGRDGVDGARGSDGISSLTAFVGAANLNSALTKLGSRNLTTYPPGQYSSSSNVSIGENEVLFMTSAKRRGENNWLYGDDNYIWSIPVLLGFNTTSTTGVDTDKFNYIYCRTLRDIDALGFYPNTAEVLKSILTYVENNPGSGIKVIPASSTVADIGSITVTNSNAVTLEGVWTDHPCGISEYLPHEWMVGYLKNEYDEWEYYFGPVLISNYGFNGLDGDGLEYIFTLSASDVAPTLTPPYTGTAGGSNTLLSGVTVASPNYLLDDFIPNGWSDEPLTPSEYLPYLYVSTRKRGGNQEGDSTWEAFTTPKLWNIYSSPGLDGSYTLFAYKNAVSSPEKPVSDSTYPPTNWTETPSTPDFANGEYTWCITRTISFDASNNPIYTNLGVWCDPYRITGDNGEPGEDGDTIEFIYRRFSYLPTWGNTNLNPNYWSANQSIDYTGIALLDNGSDSPDNKWSDNPRGVDENYPYEYVSSREYKYQNSEATSKTWGKFTTPALWCKYGLNGRDGDGFEYIFKGFSDEQVYWPSSGSYRKDDNPANWEANQDSDYLGPTGYEWEDEPVTVNNSTNKFVYVSTRKKYTDSGASNATWHQFSIPKLWALYVAPGTVGPGGLYTLFIFKTTSSDLSNPSNYTELNPPDANVESIPSSSGWSLTATTPSSSTSYIWCSHRTVTPGINSTTYGNWCAPYKISGNNGANGEGATTLVYQIIPSLNEFHYKTNHAGVSTWNPSTVTFDIYLFLGNTFTKLTSLELLANLTLERRINKENYVFSGASLITIGSNNVADLTTYTNNGATIIGKYVEINLKYNGVRTNIINIPIIRDYLRMLIPNGAYENKEYVITDTTVPLVVASNNKYYYLDADTNKTGSSPNYTYIAPTDLNLLVWVEATEYKVFLTEALFANFAKLGSFVIYGDFFFSLYGYIIDSEGHETYTTTVSDYQYFDHSDPMAETNPLSGYYKFRPMKCINSKTGEEWGAGGNIHMSANGSLTVKGNIIADTFVGGSNYSMTLLANNFKLTDSSNKTIFGKLDLNDSTISFLGDIKTGEDDEYYYPEFSNAKSYVKGEGITYLSDSYVFITDHSASSWNDNHVINIENITYTVFDETNTNNPQFIKGDGVYYSGEKYVFITTYSGYLSDFSDLTVKIPDKNTYSNYIGQHSGRLGDGRIYWNSDGNIYIGPNGCTPNGNSTLQEDAEGLYDKIFEKYSGVYKNDGIRIMNNSSTTTISLLADNNLDFKLGRIELDNLGIISLYPYDSDFSNSKRTFIKMDTGSGFSIWRKDYTNSGNTVLDSNNQRYKQSGALTISYGNSNIPEGSQLASINTSDKEYGGNSDYSLKIRVKGMDGNAYKGFTGEYNNLYFINGICIGPSTGFDGSVDPFTTPSS